MSISIETVSYSARFKADYQGLPGDLKNDVDAALKRLRQNPKSGKLRFEKLSGYRNPSIYTIHVTGNHSYKISMEIKGKEAILRRVASHKEIDRNP